MNGGRDRSRRWRRIKQRLGFVGCCGATWSPTSSTLTIMETLQEDEEEEEEEHHGYHHHHNHDEDEPVSVVVGSVPAGMNLAMALAAERNSRAAGGGGEEVVGPRSVAGQVKSLMTLIEETDGVDWSSRRKKERDHSNNNKRGNGNGNGTGEDIDWVCCVCMERSKGAAFIPCGHTFCRVCSREMLINRGSCPICNRTILEVLDIF
ncbi:uncharacterized protein LOC115699578 [Cannabis sativa]|uniref:RING-type domain-containing protein n=1 Tax=Cannabis sativa TaxID=3483 RepID=A0A7J6GU42_CANSA|nr:uncharacterized protein LOC115699578 [Cannabis sativa]XP_030482922.2 uncharacterized protein LOC115699578 [Cannabis sativa]KAF4386443.1 hypothetical protein G4B88_006699 [Cannabis sativa]